ncbi:hypothetical protein SmJEL517_g06289, partial [Synchytrium microbalum]
DGPYLGKHHDAWVLHVSGLLDILEESLQFGDGRQFVLYGDPAYPVSDHLVRPFKAPHDPAHIRFNKMMSTVRIAVEWGFGMIISRWAFLDFEKNLKLLLQPVGQYYLVCGLLTNAMTCLNGNQTSTFFGINPPNLNQYFTHEASQHDAETCFHCKTYRRVRINLVCLTVCCFIQA